MVLHCRGLCYSLSVKPQPAKRYQAGRKYCAVCCSFMKTTELRCPCCGAMYRGSGRNRRAT